MAASTDPILVGLDIGTTGVRAVQVKRARVGGEYEITRAASVDLPRGAVRGGTIIDEKAVVKALRKLWRTGRFSTRRVAFGLADGAVMTRQLELPWMPSDDFRTALRYQIGDALPVDLASVEVDYHLLGEGERTDDRGQLIELNRILVVAANSESVSAQARVVRRARLVPVVADSAAFALIRAACRGRVPTEDETRAIVDLGADHLTVVIHRGGQPRFIRTISNLGGETATIAIAERLGIESEDAETIKRTTGLNGPAPIVAPIAESSVFGGLEHVAAPVLDVRSAQTVETLNPWATAIVGEIRNSLDYFQASNPAIPVVSLAIAGRAAELDGLIERIATQIPLPVGPMDPLAGITGARGVVKAQLTDARMVVAVGLAMGARP